MKQAPTSEASRRDLAFAHFRLGHINRLIEKPDEAAREYQQSIAGFENLASGYPANGEYRAALGNAYNWLGLTLMPQPDKYADSEKAYNSALGVQDGLTKDQPQNSQYQEELARTHYNRGMLRGDRREKTPEEGRAAEADFVQAIRLLEPLAATGDRAAQELARVYNNLATLYHYDFQQSDEARGLWEKAIAIDERLSIKDPTNREYKMELATYCGNLAGLLLDREDYAEADRRSLEAVGLIEALARVAPSLAVARADAHSVRGLMLAPTDRSRAEQEYGQALDLFEQMHNDANLLRLPSFHERFADLLVNLARFPNGRSITERDRQLLARAVSVYVDMVGRIVKSGTRAEAQSAFDNLSGVLADVPEPERGRLSAAAQQLQRKLDEGGSRR